MNKKVVIAGGTGFIGGNLARHLCSKEFDVYVLTRADSNPWRLDGVKTEVVSADVTNANQIKTAVEKIRPNVVINCATHGVYRDQLDASDIYNVNIKGTHNLLEASRALSDKPLFIQTGSVYEYADLPGQRKEDTTGIPRNAYDLVKIMTTMESAGYYRSFQLPTVILRLFTVFGPYEDSRRLVPQVIQSVNEGRTPNIAPQAIRDFVYIDDVMSAYEKAINLTDHFGEVINIASGQPIHVGEFVQQILDCVDSNLKPNVSVEFAPANDSQCWADITKAKKLLNWEPQYNTRTAIQLTVNWHQNHAKQ